MLFYTLWEGLPLKVEIGPDMMESCYKLLDFTLIVLKFCWSFFDKGGDIEDLGDAIFAVVFAKFLGSNFGSVKVLFVTFLVLLASYFTYEIIDYGSSNDLSKIIC